MAREYISDIGHYFKSDTREKFLLLGKYKGKSSFLHLAINDIPIRLLGYWLDSIPSSIRKDYLQLQDAKSQTVLDIAHPDRADLIRIFLEEKRDTTLENNSQNVHVASVHHSVDESIIRLMQNLKSNSNAALPANFEMEVSDSARRIKFNHELLKPFVEREIAKLKRELTELHLLDDKQFFDSYIKPRLVRFEIEGYETNPKKKEKLIAYKKFQIEKAKDLIEDVINHGHTGNKYHYINDINKEQENGLNIKEMLALSYFSSQDTSKLVRAGRAYQSLEQDEQNLCALEAKMKFLEGLYSIRRGYNLDHGTDDKDKMTFSREAIDENVCPGGTVNRLGDALNGMHPDIEIRAFEVRLIKEKIQKLSIAIINDYIDEHRMDLDLAMQLREWKVSEIMPLKLQDVIYKKVQEILVEEHPLITEFEKDFSLLQINGNIAKNAIKEFKYPAKDLHQVQVNIEGMNLQNIFKLL